MPIRSALSSAPASPASPESGLFVKLNETGADGFVPAATLGDDYYRYEEGTRSLVGARTKVAYRLGDPVQVRLVEAAPFAGALKFEIVAGSASERPARRGARPQAARPSRKASHKAARR